MFTVLAFIGVLSIISGVVKTGMKIFDNTAEKQEYNTLLAPLVMYDPLPFETPDTADRRVLLASSLWAAIMNEDMSPTNEDYAEIVEVKDKNGKVIYYKK